MKKHIGIIGGAGYTAGELIRLLLNHPHVSIRFVHSESQAGRPVTTVHDDLVGETDLTFTSEVDPEVDVLFFCMGHGKTKPFLAQHALPPEMRIIDLGSDYRIAGADHDFVYGLPELNREAIAQARHVANPGCFATAIQLGLLPLADAGLLSDEIHVHAITGSTGAGQQPSPTTHFSWREGNLSIYKAFEHQHLAEIGQSLVQAQPGFDAPVRFLPLRGGFTRGIFASMYTRTSLSGDDLRRLYQYYYEPHPFTHVADANPHLKQVVQTNKCLVYPEQHGDTTLIVSLIDNLLKGASGQAVQNMNLMMGWDEWTGLWLKPGGF
ncbi:MAG: N-acetyl-gamma-glutamyl-phosphate reductase [Bacteroidia bacterium]